MLPIVLGCKAIIIGATQNKRNIGKEVIVVAKVENEYGSGWRVEAEGIINKYGHRGYANYLNRHLLRIDGGSFSKERESEKVREKA